MSRARTRLREVLEPYFERGATVADHAPRLLTPDTSTPSCHPCPRPHPQPDTPDTDELVAYLDGELSADECRRVERRLASDADYRRRLTELEQAWSALEALPPTMVDDDFARTTIEMVAVAAERDVSERVGDAGGDRPAADVLGWRRAALAIARGGVCGGAAVVCRAGTMRWWPTCR